MKKIEICIPNGSMEKTITNLFANAGLEVIVERKRKNEGKINVPWIDYVSFHRPQEIPDYLDRGFFDVAFIGEDWIADWGYNFPTLLKLPIGRNGTKAVRIVLAVRKDSGFEKVEDLPKGCIVSTEYVRLTTRFLSKIGRKDIQVMFSFGNTEQKIKFGAAAIVDIMESGESLRENNLIVISELMESAIVIAVNPKSYCDKEKQSYIDCLVALIKGAYQASQYVFLVANVPQKSLTEASQIMGGLKGPTCSALTVENWFALQSIVLRKDEQKVIFKLLQIGVTDIVVNREIPLIMN